MSNKQYFILALIIAVVGCANIVFAFIEPEEDELSKFITGFEKKIPLTLADDVIVTSVYPSEGNVVLSVNIGERTASKANAIMDAVFSRMQESYCEVDQLEPLRNANVGIDYEFKVHGHSDLALQRIRLSNCIN